MKSSRKLEVELLESRDLPGGLAMPSLPIQPPKAVPAQAKVVPSKPQGVLVMAEQFNVGDRVQVKDTTSPLFGQRGCVVEVLYTSAPNLDPIQVRVLLDGNTEDQFFGGGQLTNLTPVPQPPAPKPKK